MTPDNLANGFKSHFDRLHVLINAHPDPKQRAKFEKAAKLFHEAGDRLLTLVKAEKHPTGKPIVSTFSGGEPKPRP